MLETVLATKKIKSLVLDVRGTIIHPVLDVPLSTENCRLVKRLLDSEVVIALNTATSIKSLEVLVLGPLLSILPEYENNLERFIMYVDSSTQAYKVNYTRKIVPLHDFAFHSFEEAELNSVLQCIETSKARFNRSEATHKVKPGQVNFYCGGAWEDRLNIARYMNETFRGEGYQRLTAMVPSAKETIDVAVCLKARGIHDLTQRYALEEAEILIIGDSFQEGGSDLDMLNAKPDAVAVQVGEHEPAALVHHVKSRSGPDATQHILREVIASLTS